MNNNNNNSRALFDFCTAIIQNPIFALSGKSITDFSATEEFEALVNGSIVYKPPPWIKLTLGIPDYYERAFGSMPVSRCHDFFENELPHSNRAAKARTVMIIAIILTLVVLALRMFARKGVLKMFFRLDDWLIVTASFGAILMHITTIVGAEICGVGKRIWDITGIEYSRNYLHYEVFALIMVLTLFVIRLSFLEFYRQLYAYYKFQRTLLAVLIIISLGTLLNIGLLIPHLHCASRLVAYKPVQPFCLTLGAKLSWLDAFMSIFLLLSDLTVLILPIFIVKALNLKMKEKIRVGFLFGVGILATIAGVMRTVLVLIFKYDTDLAYVELVAAGCIVLEVFLAIACSSAPAIRAAVLFWKNGVISRHISAEESGVHEIERGRTDSKKSGGSKAQVSSSKSNARHSSSPSGKDSELENGFENITPVESNKSRN